MRCYVSNKTNPYLNIAFERELLDRKEEAIFLWVNEPSVIIGRNQNPYAEVNLEYIKKMGIKLVRRYSGGGAVYHDFGNLNFSYITNGRSASKIIELLKEVLEEFQIVVKESGRNDLIVQDKKISGMAYLLEDEWTLYHGTCLVDLNIDHLLEALTPSKIKLSSKGICSVKTRVVNLSDLSKQISVGALINQFEKQLKINGEYPEWNKLSNKKIKKLSSDEWLFGQSPNFSAQFEEKTPNGLFQLYLDIEDNIISEISLYTDSLNPELDDSLFKNLKGQPFNTINRDLLLEKMRLL